jgi:hypothetical protein
MHKSSQYRWIVLLTLFPPASLFYFLLWKSFCALPIADDYHAVLGFTDRFALSSGLGQKLMTVLTFQHNEYKLIFESCVYAVQWSLTSHIDFVQLAFLGNSFTFLIYLILVMMYRVPSESPMEYAALLLPPPLLLFQLQYASTLNWVMASLQNLPVIFLVLLAIALTAKRTVVSFTLACLCIVVGIAASGNGFLGALVCLFMLSTQRRWKEIAVLGGLCLCVAAVYFYRYDISQSQTAPGHSILHSVAKLSPAYALSFLGSSLTNSTSYRLSICVGAVLCGIVGLMIKMRYYRANPSVFFSTLFILTTALAVSGLRSEFGILQSLASRYRIYSDILLILSYIFLIETYWPKLRRSEWSNRLMLPMFVVASCLFCAASDWAGFRFLKVRRELVRYEMALYLGTQGDRLPDAIVSGTDPVAAQQLKDGFYKPNGPYLVESMRLGVYRPSWPLMTDR